MDPSFDDDVLLMLSFSGGGTRAAAFSFGVLQELDRARSASKSAKSLLDRVEFVSGVSGGSITAAYFGLKQRTALADFRERFLLRNAEENLKTAVSLANIGRALNGGVNDNQFPRWLDENLFDGATFDAFGAGHRPRVWINASDIYNRTPFVFGPVAFDALCSDIRSYKIADAVAASAAVPLAFAPIVLETFPGGCSTRLPGWIDRARHNPDAQPLLRSFAEATARYHDGSMKYVKLLDGGLVDNFGLSGFSIGILAAQRGHDPMTEKQALLAGAADIVPGGRCRPRTVRQLGQQSRGAERNGTGDGRRRHGHRCERAFELRGVLHVARRVEREGAAVALRIVAGRSRPARSARGLEMRGTQHLH
jgi:NTE family protein